MGADASQVDKARFPSATPRWLKTERFFLAASGLSICVCTGIWAQIIFGGGPSWLWRSIGPAFILVGIALPYVATLFLLRPRQSHRILQWVIVVLSFSIALFPPIFVLGGFLAGLRNLLGIPLVDLMLVLSMKSKVWIFEIAVIWPLINGLWVFMLVVLLCHACLSAAAREAYRQDGGTKVGVLFAFIVTAVLAGSATLILLKWILS